MNRLQDNNWKKISFINKYEIYIGKLVSCDIFVRHCLAKKKKCHEHAEILLRVTINTNDITSIMPTDPSMVDCNQITVYKH